MTGEIKAKKDLVFVTLMRIVEYEASSVLDLQPHVVKTQTTPQASHWS